MFASGFSTAVPGPKPQTPINEYGMRDVQEKLLKAPKDPTERCLEMDPGITPHF